MSSTDSTDYSEIAYLNYVPARTYSYPLTTTGYYEAVNYPPTSTVQDVVLDSTALCPTTEMEHVQLPAKNRRISKTPKPYTDEEEQRILELELTNGDEILTENLCERIIYELKMRVVSQKKFAKNVLSRSQGTFSDLCNNPKPWKDMIECGRATYQKILLWINMPEGETKQKVLEGEVPVSPAQPETSSEEDSASRPPKRKRIKFTPEQLNGLQAAIKKWPYASVPTRETIATELNLPKVCVHNWFANTRRAAKASRVAAERMETISVQEAAHIVEHEVEEVQRQVEQEVEQEQ